MRQPVPIILAMKFYVLKTRDPYLNLAIEEYLFYSETDDVFMLWQNDPTVVIGKNQNVYAEINFEYLKKHNIKVSRRITGGGAVYHDGGNVNYTFISSANDSGIDFEHFTAPIIEVLADMGVHAKLSGRNDIQINDKKISGNAQYSHNGRVLHHGTLLFDSDISVLSSVLSVDEEKIKTKAIRSVASRVANIKDYLSEEYDIEKFISRISEFVERKYSTKLQEAPMNDEILRLCARNASPDWIYPDRKMLSEYSFTKKRKYPFGLVVAYIKMENDKMSDIKIRGDFFAIAPIEELERAVLKYYGSLEGKLDISVSDYIFGMDNDTFLEFLRGE